MAGTPNKRKRDPKSRHNHYFTMKIVKDRKTGALEREYGPPVKVIWPENEIQLDLTEADVLLAHSKGGEGDTRHCAVACLIKRQAAKFMPYAVNGVVEFMDSRAFVGIGSPGHYPKKALRYEHSCGWLTEMFDRQGYKELIKRIKEAGGTLTVTLRPYRLRLKESSPGKLKVPKDGSRSRHFTLVRGEMRRSMRLDSKSIGQAIREAEDDDKKAA